MSNRDIATSWAVGRALAGAVVVAALTAGCAASTGGEADAPTTGASGAVSGEEEALAVVSSLDLRVEVGGGSITVVEMQSEISVAGSVGVLFLHGAAFTSQTWVDNGILSTVASSGHRAVAIDLPGSGSSDDVGLADDEFLVALFGALELDPTSTVVVSPSMSGSFSLPALRHPFFVDLAGYVPVAPVGSSSFADEGAVVAVPALVVWGDRDGDDPQAAAERLAQGFVDAEVLIMADAGHAAYESQPAAFTAALLDFLDTVAS